MKFGGSILKEFGNQVTYVVKDSKHFQEIANFHTLNFLKGCLLIKGINCDYDSIYKLFYLSLQHSMSDKMLYHTIDSEDNSSLSGFIAMKASTKNKLVEDVEKDLKKNFSEKLDIIMDIIDQVSSPLSLTNPSYLLCFSAASSSKYKRLGSEITQLALKDIRSYGYDGLYCETTGPVSRKIMENIGGKCVKEVEYSNYKYKGRKVLPENYAGGLALIEINFKNLKL